MKKRAFVRYSKQGKVVPGSLVITSGTHPSGPSTWKEVPADLCCEETSEPFIFTVRPDGGGTVGFALTSNNGGAAKGTIDWGDGSSIETFELPLFSWGINLWHNYSSGNDSVLYNVKVNFTSVKGLSQIWLADYANTTVAVSNLGDALKGATPIELYLYDSAISTLDLTNVPLNYVDLTDTNSLSSIIVAGNKTVQEIDISNSLLTSIDYSGCSNMTQGYVYNNPNLSTVNITGTTKLEWLYLGDNALTEETIEHILTTLDANGLTNGYVDVSGGTSDSLTVAAATAKSNLQVKGWTVANN